VVITLPQACCTENSLVHHSLLDPHFLALLLEAEKRKLELPLVASASQISHLFLVGVLALRQAIAHLLVVEVQFFNGVYYFSKLNC
jgi:hypothetical protein